MAQDRDNKTNDTRTAPGAKRECQYCIYFAMRDTQALCFYGNIINLILDGPMKTEKFACCNRFEMLERYVQR